MGPSRELTYSILLGAALLALVGLGVQTLVLAPVTLSGQLEAFFPAGPWRTGAYATGGLFGLAVTLTATTLCLEWLGGSRTITFQQLGSDSIEKTLDEVRARVSKCMGRRPPDVALGLDVLLRGAMLLHASDIHLNPTSDGLKVTYRVDGVLYQVLSVPKEFASRLSARVKVLARLESFSLEPQDGGLRRRVGDIEVEARVSSLPSNHGERVVMRLVRGGETVSTISGLGFEPSVTGRLLSILHKPQGIFLVSGPVGSGKTTTLYACLQHLHEIRGDTTSLVTLEDPIEHQLPYAVQTQINPKVGMTFAQTLRSVLRQDPGALMLGEIRDKETAEIATQAGLTGHLILTTLHVQSAAGTFARLMDMNVEPFVLSSACEGSLAQRLVRELCPDCKAPLSPDEDTAARFRLQGIHLPTEATFFGPVGCAACESRGYMGRIPIAEFLLMSEQLREAVRDRASTAEINRIAIAQGMVPLIESGLARAVRGETSLAEVLRVAG